jgi:hypothetical protein
MSNATAEPDVIDEVHDKSPRSPSLELLFQDDELNAIAGDAGDAVVGPYVAQKARQDATERASRHRRYSPPSRSQIVISPSVSFFTGYTVYAEAKDDHQYIPKSNLRAVGWRGG